MVDINLPNAFTIGVISIGAYALYKFVTNKFGAPSWMN